jgi:polysaccharide pyruvyl transferase WcaK-like protein
MIKNVARMLKLGFIFALVKSILRSLLQALKALVRFSGYARPQRPGQHLRIKPGVMKAAEKWGSFRPPPYPRILNASGHGYGNVGDEAQLGACLARWRKAEPDCSLLVFSPNPGFTQALHDVPVAWAPRVAWFHANTGGPYNDSLAFQWGFLRTWIRLNITARCMRAGIPLMLANADEAEILRLVQTHDVLHISGGGFLTGMTRSRLWENCLLIRCAQLLGTPVLLTGHNIGVFRHVGDRILARLAFRGVKYIGLRDGDQSPAALKSVGIREEQIHADCDDALLFDPLPPAEVAERLRAQGVDPGKPWVAVNFHWWGQPENERARNETRFAEVCDYIASQHGLYPVFISMVPTDHPANLAVLSRMKQPAKVLDYAADHRYIRGVIAGARMVFTMKHHPIIFAQGECVPTVAVALDDYYTHKNKGALGNSGHARFVLERDAFFGPEVFTRIDEARTQDDQLRAELINYIAERKKEEFTPYQRSNWNLSK